MTLPPTNAAPDIAGTSRGWDDEDLDRLANVTPANVSASRANARQYPALNALLTAGETDDGGGDKGDDEPKFEDEERLGEDDS